MDLMNAIIGALGRREKWGAGVDNRFNRLILTLCAFALKFPVLGARSVSRRASTWKLSVNLPS